MAVLWRSKRPVGKQLVEDTGVGELVGVLSQVDPRMSRSAGHALQVRAARGDMRFKHCLRRKKVVPSHFASVLLNVGGFSGLKGVDGHRGWKDGGILDRCWRYP